MPVEFRIDVAEHIVLSRAWGELTDEELTSGRASLFADPHFEPDLCQLYDFSEVTRLAVTPACVRELAVTSRFALDAKRAIVVSTDVGFGMARMYGLMSGRSDESFRVFRSVERAMTWLEGREVLLP